MSTEVKPADEDRLSEAMARLRSDESGAAGSFVVVGHVDGDPNTIDVVAEGSGGCQELITFLDDAQVMYILLRMEEVFDMTSNIKFAYIHWVGSKTPFTKKGRYGVVHGSVKTYFGSSHCSLECDNKDDVNEEAIMGKIAESSGTKSKVLDTTDSSRQHRGFTSVPVSKPPQKQGLVPSVSKQGAETSFNPEVPSGIADVRDDGTETNWVLVGYEGKDVKKPLSLIGSGSEGIEELKQHIEEDAVLYGLYRLTDVVDEHATVKFAFITWVGEKVKPMSKAKVSTHKGAVEDLFFPAHVSIYATQTREIDAQDILDKVMSVSGSKSHVMRS